MKLLNWTGPPASDCTFASPYRSLSPVIAVQVTLAIITALKQMETVFLTTNGGPGDATQFLAVYLYNQAFAASQYGYANAISIVFIVVCLIFTYLSNKLIRSDAPEY
ncbi:hypothetical protein LJK87_21960 [Paenibacillus sp. P25]|nr:hypothetical protein LJK87_21960 [Paenibacillus sp. P25]